eukprot:CAMPEP_0197839166 /NCGR_PEP_ID=MMETSP1437-20131217/41429_1 /TAXON_ID=49252 ORGANISM="Eucampia antarctica, Strain CCMP1452" /NCGR_SAMPLE_ID=MMETSP1437 /ASSEMBLY_ACC=CAM_ASM_001096 /LENGTH=44 /DNA_ID= /DNA_START= /DNA_END= /DNA_ORIENTATION=
MADYYQKVVLGDPLEKAILAACQWTIHANTSYQNQTIVYPPTTT